MAHWGITDPVKTHTPPLTSVICTVARARGGVVPTPGITVIGAPRARPAAVMPGVGHTPGRPRPRDARGVARGGGVDITGGVDLGLISAVLVAIPSEDALIVVTGSFGRACGRENGGTARSRTI